MAWRFGAVGADAVLAVVSNEELFVEWMPGVPAVVRMDARWPDAGSVISQETDRQSRGKHLYDRHLTVAIVEAWRPEHGIALRLHSGLGGWVHLTITVHPRPGGTLIEVVAEPLTASARLRYSGPAHSRTEERCLHLIESLIRLAMIAESEDE